MPIKYPFYIRFPLILLSLILVLFLLIQASSIFIPLTFSVLLAILLLPVTKLFEKKLLLGRSLSATLAILLFISLFTGFIYILSTQFINFTDDFPMLKTRFIAITNTLQHWISHKLKITTYQQSDYLQKSSASIIQSITYFFSNMLYSISTVLIWTIFIFLFTFFIIYYRKLLNKFILNLFKQEYQTNVSNVVQQTKQMINGYILALLMEMVIVCIANCSLLLILGVRYAVLLGMIAAVLNIIPYLGIYTSITISMVITFANSSLNQALAVGLGLFIIHLIDANYLLPRLVGGRVKMNPFITILAVMCGELLWGVPGMFLFIPIIGILKLICEQVPGLEAWAILIGVEEKTIKNKALPKKIISQ